jgi:hypothetical protein
MFVNLFPNMYVPTVRGDDDGGQWRRRGGLRSSALLFFCSSVLLLLRWHSLLIVIERVAMGGKSSKPLRDAGRAVLARRQVPVEPPVHVPPQATPSVQHVDMPHAHHEPAPAREEPAHLAHVPSEDKRIPLQMESPAPSSSQSQSQSQSSTVEPPVFPEQRPPSSDDFSNPSGAPLPPDLLAAISKWQVRKNVAPQVRSLTRHRPHCDRPS